MSQIDVNEYQTSTLPIRAEAEVLLCVASVGEVNSRIERLRALLQKDLDWDYVLRASEHHCIASLAYWHLKKAGLERVPESAAAALRDSFARTRERNMMFVQELMHLVKLLQAHGIPVIPYKGPLLAQALYEDLAQRQMWDLDLLIKEEDLSRAKRLMLEDGYTQKATLTPEEEERVRKQNDEEVFHSPRNGLEIELHWRLMPAAIGKASPSEFVWNHARQVTVFGTPVRTLPAEVFALIIFLHAGVKHRWSQLKFLADAARIISKYKNLDWTFFIDEATQRKEERPVLLGAYLANALLQAPLPAPLAERIKRDPELPVSAALTMGQLFREGFGFPGFEEWRGYARAFLRRQTNGRIVWTPFGERQRYVRAMLTPQYGDKYRLRRFPRVFFFLQYLARPLGIVIRNGLGVIGRIR